MRVKGIFQLNSSDKTKQYKYPVTISMSERKAEANAGREI